MKVVNHSKNKKSCWWVNLDKKSESYKETSRHPARCAPGDLKVEYVAGKYDFYGLEFYAVDVPTQYYYVDVKNDKLYIEDYYGTAIDSSTGERSRRISSIKDNTKKKRIMTELKSKGVL
jgi:hypothetical protein